MFLSAWLIKVPYLSIVEYLVWDNLFKMNIQKGFDNFKIGHRTCKFLVQLRLNVRTLKSRGY